MGHLEALRGERLHTAGHQPESGVALVLDRGLEQELEPETDPQHGHPRLESLPYERVEAELANAAHGTRKRPHARQDHAVGGPYPLGVVGDLGTGANSLERLLDRAQVAHPVVQHHYVRHQVSVPLVDGTPLSPGSISTAPRSARANALKHASISSASNPAIETGGRSASNRHSGLPEMSIAHMPSASSIGTAM